MKKYVLLALILGVNATAFAKPMVIRVNEIQFIKVQGEEFIESSPKTLSRGNQDTLCWTTEVSGAREGTMLNVVEEFRSPAKGVYTGDSNTLKITSSKDKKRWTIEQQLEVSNKEIGTCWTMVNDDPLGKFTLGITINGLAQNSFTYVLKK